MSFPIGPTNGQTTVINNIQYIYNAANNAWKRVPLDNLTLQNLTVTGNTYYNNGSYISSAMVYDLDQIYGDGTTNVFQLKYNQQTVTVPSPWNLQVSIDGLVQPAFRENYEIVWGSHVFGAARGYTISSGNIKFSDPPESGEIVIIRTLPGSPNPTAKRYPFKAVDIMVGF